MRSKGKDNIEEFSQVTCDLLYLTNNLKLSTKNSMVVGEHGILKGITIVQEIIMELNPQEVNDQVIEMITNCAEAYISKYENEREHVDNNMRLGAMQSYMAIDIYNKGKKRELVNPIKNAI